MVDWQMDSDLPPCTEFSLTWTIPDFCKSLRDRCHRALQSPYFGDPEGRSSWYLEVYPRGSARFSNDHMSLFLFLDSMNRVRVRVTLALLDAKGKQLYPMSEVKWFDKSCRYFDGSFGEQQYVPVETARALTWRNTLTVYCKMQFVGDNGAPEHLDSTAVHSGQCTGLASIATQGLLARLQAYGHGDLVLVVGSNHSTCRLREFSMHRIVLCAVSPVFAAMFSHDTVEKHSGTVYITDLDPNSILALLELIYHDGDIAVLDGMSLELIGQCLIAIDKYGMESLLTILEYYLASELNNMTAIYLLAVAKCYNAVHLLKNVINYINAHHQELIYPNSEEFCCPALTLDHVEAVLEVAAENGLSKLTFEMYICLSSALSPDTLKHLIHHGHIQYPLLRRFALKQMPNEDKQTKVPLTNHH